ncbi:MAG: response regulator [Candidatus Dadabacteria bacterium]|nr:response regulator [Candidatus Dadabacteria bacterium]NIS07262.1 response regulator [Candidatus Dadabacteria bacterium]NIV40969.1 response regulator [Candidatus Dadabacteria bacterium]NIY21200.1 response regulator [Candidatus Dadabacteria bacterium]
MDSNEEIKGGMIVLEDITQRKRMENAITEEKEMLSITLRSIGNGVITTNSEGEVILLNHVAEQITEWSQKDASGKKLEEVLIWDNEANTNINDIQTGRALQQGKILVMDDDEVIREIAGSILAYLGYEVSFASDGKEAIDLYKEAFENNEKYDVVIMDLTVPGGMGAEDTIKQLKNIDPDIKAIVASVYSNAQIDSL